MIYDWYCLSRFMVMTKQLLVLLGAGSPILKCLEMVRPKGALPKFQARFDLVMQGILNGDDFMRSWSLLLPRYMRFSCLLFYRFPDHVFALKHVKTFYEERLKQAQKTGRQLIYPAVLMLSIMSLLGIFLTIIFPQYRQFFSTNGVSEPVFIQVITAVLFFFQGYGAFLVLGVALSCIIAMFWYREWVKSRLFLWFFSIHHTDILRLLAITQEKSIPLKESLRPDSFELLKNGALEYQLFLDRFLSSGDFSGSWSRTFVLPSFYSEWLSNIRSEGQLSVSLLSFCESIADFLKQRRSKRLAMINPILLVCLAVLILVFLMTLYLPLLSLSSTIAL